MRAPEIKVLWCPVAAGRDPPVQKGGTPHAARPSVAQSASRPALTTRAPIEFGALPNDTRVVAAHKKGPPGVSRAGRYGPRLRKT